MAIKTVLTYQLNGITTEFGVPFEYLSRRFVKVWLIGDSRRELTLNVDYRFINKKTIKTTQAWGSAQGFKYLEVRRVTSATDRIVDFTDGSILRASDLNVSQIQAMHIAEEARDLAADSLYVDDFGNLDARGRRIVNVGEGRESTHDAVTMQFIGKTTDSIVQMRDQVKKDTTTTTANKTLAETARKVAESARDSAKSSEGKAKASAENAKASETKAKDSMLKAQASESNARNSEVKARADAQIAETARISSKQSEVNSKESEVNAKKSEVNSKIYNDGAASNKAEIDRLAGLVKDASNLTDNAKTYALDASNSSVASARHAEASAQSAIQSDTNLTKCKGHEAATAVYEEEARESKEAAKVSETNAKTSETRSKESELNAKKYSDNVDTNANRIEEVKSLISDTKQLVDQAEAFALDASSSSVASAQHSKSAAESAEQTDVNLTKCKGHEAATAVYEEEARKSKEEAKVSETNASSSKDVAIISANTAQTSKQKAEAARAVAEAKANEAKGSEASAAESAKASATSASQAAASAKSILGQLELNTAQANKAAESARQAAASAQSVNANNLLTKSGLLGSTGQATNNTMHQKAITDSLDRKAAISSVHGFLDILSTNKYGIAGVFRGNGIPNIDPQTDYQIKILEGNRFGFGTYKSGESTTLVKMPVSGTVPTNEELDPKLNSKADKNNPSVTGKLNITESSSQYGEALQLQVKSNAERATIIANKQLAFWNSESSTIARVPTKSGTLLVESDLTPYAPKSTPTFISPLYIDPKVSGSYKESTIALKIPETSYLLSLNVNERKEIFFWNSETGSKLFFDMKQRVTDTILTKRTLIGEWQSKYKGSPTPNVTITHDSKGGDFLIGVKNENGWAINTVPRFLEIGETLTLRLWWYNGSSQGLALVKDSATTYTVKTLGSHAGITDVRVREHG